MKMLYKKKKIAKTKVDEEATKAKARLIKLLLMVDQAKTSGETTISSIQPEVVKKQKQNAQLMMQ